MFKKKSIILLFFIVITTTLNVVLINQKPKQSELDLNSLFKISNAYGEDEGGTPDMPDEDTSFWEGIWDSITEAFNDTFEHLENVFEYFVDNGVVYQNEDGSGGINWEFDNFDEIWNYERED